MKRVRLVADDFGLSAPVSRGILALAARGRIADTSCLVGGAAWAGWAREAAASGLRLGLHLNLTEGRPLSPALAALWPVLPPLARLIAQAHLRALPLAALRDEFGAQLAAFEQGCGSTPVHVDGHQHVHHLPQVRGLLLELLAARPGVVARHTGNVGGPGFGVKRLLIERTGGRALGRRLESMGRCQNRCLLGVYDFGKRDYRRLMQGWLAAAPGDGALVFCHPGEAGGGDAIAPARARELAYLGSDAFADDLAGADAGLA